MNTTVLTILPIAVPNGEGPPPVVGYVGTLVELIVAGSIGGRLEVVLTSVSEKRVAHTHTTLLYHPLIQSGNPSKDSKGWTGDR